MARPQVNIVAVAGTAHAIVRGPETLCGKTHDPKEPTNRYYATTRRNYLAPLRRIKVNADRDVYAVCKECQRALLDVPTEDVNFYREFPVAV